MTYLIFNSFNQI